MSTVKPTAADLRNLEIMHVRDLHEEGLKNGEIADRLNIPESTVRHILKNWTR